MFFVSVCFTVMNMAEAGFIPGVYSSTMEDGICTVRVGEIGDDVWVVVLYCTE